MNDDESWTEYARIQALADSRHLSDQAWAADEALENILDSIECRQTVSAQQTDNLLTNRAKKQRRRRNMIARHHFILQSVAANENDRIDARSELVWCEGQCGAREWRVLVGVGLGHAYSGIAKAEHVPEATIKTWVRRARLKLAV